MLSVTSWRWYNWLLLLGGALVVGGYFGLVSLAPLDEALQRVAGSSKVGDVFQHAGGRQEALFVLFTFLLLTPLAVLVGLFMIVFAFAILMALVGPVTRSFGVPDGATSALLVLGAGALAYVKADAWLPPFQLVLGLVVRAFLVVRP